MAGRTTDCSHNLPQSMQSTYSRSICTWDRCHVALQLAAPLRTGVGTKCNQQCKGSRHKARHSQQVVLCVRAQPRSGTGPASELEILTEQPLLKLLRQDGAVLLHRILKGGAGHVPETGLGTWSSVAGSCSWLRLSKESVSKRASKARSPAMRRWVLQPQQHTKCSSATFEGTGGAGRVQSVILLKRLLAQAPQPNLLCPTVVEAAAPSCMASTCSASVDNCCSRPHLSPCTPGSLLRWALLPTGPTACRCPAF